MAEPELSLPQGIVAGKYRLTGLLGRGGMGAVWEGQHTTLGTRVAVKFIDAEYAESPEARSRFDNEARAAARLRSKHVVEVYDHGVSEDGRPFIVMEYLQGEPLDRRLDRVGRLPAKEVARMVLQICRALTKAHAAGIVHRDLKPENVFLVWDDEDGSDIVKVVDFGIAKFTDASLGSSSATRTGSVLGTPYYMSPEQARGLRSVDSRSDLWSIGVITYRAIVGRLPFEGEAVGDLLVKLCTAPIPVPSQVTPDVPPGFDAWLLKALCREPEGRFRTAMELGESLCAVCGMSVRGQYATGDTPMFSGGPVPRPVLDSVATARGLAAVAAATGAPTTQTPTPAQRTGKSAIVAGSLAALIVLGIGIGVVVKKLSAKPDAELGAPALTNAPTLTNTPGLTEPKSTELKAPEPPAAPAPSVVVALPSASTSAQLSAALPAAPQALPLQQRWVAPPRPAVAVRPSAPADKPAAKKDIDIGY